MNYHLVVLVGSATKGKATWALRAMDEDRYATKLDGSVATFTKPQDAVDWVSKNSPGSFVEIPASVDLKVTA